MPRYPTDIQEPAAIRQSSETQTEWTAAMEEVKESIKKVPRRIDGSRVGRRDRPEEFFNSSNESISTPRKVKNAEKQRRREEVLDTVKPLTQRTDRPQKSQAQKSLRRVGSDAAPPRQVFEEVIQQVTPSKLS